MTGFVKLYGSITSSSVWSESKDTRIVWITMLAEADPDGKVDASLPGLARLANLTLAECEAAVAVLIAPDRYSRTKDNDGRRIEPVDGGWLILNHKKYRDMRSPAQIAEAERKAAYRARQKDGTVPDCPGTDGEIRAEVEEEVEAEGITRETTTTPSSPTLETIASTFPNPEGALAMLEGMTQGMGTPGMKPVPVSTLLETHGELRAVGGDVTPSRFKGFLKKILARANGHAPRSTDKATQSSENIAEWLAGKEQTTDAEVIDG